MSVEKKIIDGKGNKGISISTCNIASTPNDRMIIPSDIILTVILFYLD
jgi:hypothetical protein